jgi:hypothetical protein
MSFMLTKEQIRKKQKTVTRRLGWWFLKPGDVVWACEKCMGLKKGAKVKRICLIQIVDTHPEPLTAITQEECAKEGFPDMTPDQFIKMFCELDRCKPDTIVNRIEFRYGSSGKDQGRSRR